MHLHRWDIFDDLRDCARIFDRPVVAVGTALRRHPDTLIHGRRRLVIRGLVTGFAARFAFGLFTLFLGT